LEKATAVGAPVAIESPATTVATAPASVVMPGPVTAPAIVMASPPVTMLSESSALHTHVVQKGDTLQSLALRYYGTRSSWEKIYQANRSGLPSKDQLKVGQQLVIP
jgi:nucleoid-associated protein YgaU